MLESYLLNLLEGMKGKEVKKKSKKKSNKIVLDPQTVEPEDTSQDDGGKLIQIGGIYGYKEDAKPFRLFRREAFISIEILEEHRQIKMT